MYGYQAMLGLGQGGIIVSGTIAIKLSASKTDAGKAPLIFFDTLSSTDVDFNSNGTGRPGTSTSIW
jgi:hypothetical protein